MSIEFHTMEVWHQNLTAEKLNELIEDLNGRTQVPFNERFSINADWIGGRQFLIYNSLVDHIKDQLGYDMVRGKVSSLADWQQQRIWGGIQELSRYINKASDLIFISQPQSQTVDEYATATFTAAATDATSYQWSKNAANVGTDSTSYAFATTAADNGAVVNVTATGAGGSTVSNNATLTVVSYVYRMDGLTQRMTTGARLINPDGDIDITFMTGPNVSSGVSDNADRCVLSQCLTATNSGSSGKEFTLYFNSSGLLRALHGGNFLPASSNSPLRINTKYRWRLQGSVQTFWVDDIQVDSNTISRGVAREPSAKSVIGAQNNGNDTTFRAFFDGGIYGLKVISASNNEIPINNKSQGASQLATVGSINATIVNYNAAGWVAI